MRLTVRATAAATLTLLLAPLHPAWGGAASPTKVLGGREFQSQPAGNDGYLLWSQNSTSRPRRVNAFYSTDGGITPVKMNAAGTTGWIGDVDNDSTEAIYQQIDDGQSDLYFYDLATQVRTPISDVNSNYWEWGPVFSDGYILFVRDLASQNIRRLLLYQRGGSVTQLFGGAFRRVYLEAGEVGSAYAAWTKCERNCTAWHYEIATDTMSRIPTVRRKPQYAPTLDETTGLLFWVRSGERCGQNVTIWSAPLTDPTAQTRVTRLPRGIDVAARLATEHETVDNRLDLLIPWYRCRSGNTDIYEVAGVASLT